MAYCRTSSDDFQSDVYVIRMDNIYQIMVATHKHDITEAMPEPVSKDDWEACEERDEKVLEIVNRSPLVPLELPLAGEFINLSTPGDCADKLEAMRAEGYRVPQHAIDKLRKESEESKK